MGKTLRINLHIDEDCDGPLYAALDRLPPKKRASKIRLLALLSVVRDEKLPRVTGVTGMQGDLLSSACETPTAEKPQKDNPSGAPQASETSPETAPTKAGGEGFGDLMDFSVFEGLTGSNSNVGTPQ